MGSKLLVLLVFVSSTAAVFDYVQDSFRYVDENVDPCDNFYRHACPTDPYAGEYLIEDSYKETLQKLLNKQENRIWENLEIHKTLKEVHQNILPATYELITEIFRYKCENEEDKSTFLEYVQQFTFGDTQCHEDECLAPLGEDEDCERAAEILQSRIGRFNSVTAAFHVKKGLEPIGLAKDTIAAVSTLLDGDLRHGVATVGEIVDSMVNLLDEWIEETPWAINKHAVEAIRAEIDQVHQYDNYALVLRNFLDYVARLEQTHLLCTLQVGNSEIEQLFCALYANGAIEKPEMNQEFFNFFNAVNDHPFLHFSYYFYDIAQNVEEFAAVLGAAGSVVGHEVAHTLIENPNRLQLLPVFSNETMECVTNQYQKTCDTYKEDECFIGEHQIDENGSDILGRQLAYSLLEEHYKDRLQEEYLELKNRSVTYQQLFFYAYVFATCQMGVGTDLDGSVHAPFYIRGNVIAQHPGFQEAFQCAPESKMMQSANEECIIFGEGAPETKRHKFHRN